MRLLHFHFSDICDVLANADATDEDFELILRGDAEEKNYVVIATSMLQELYALRVPSRVTNSSANK